MRVAPAGDNGSMDTSPRCSDSEWTLVQEEGPALSCLGFCCIILSSIMAWWSWARPAALAGEINCAGRTGSSYEKLRSRDG